MSFDVEPDAYDRFIGRYSTLLAPQLADLAGVVAGQHVLDVGCGPGALTTELVRRLGADAVSAVDPSEPFVAAARERHPGVDVRLATAEQLPFADQEFDAALAQLVVHFMADPVAGLREMGLFWEAAHELDADVEDESNLAGAREGHLAELFAEAGLDAIQETSLSVSVEHPTFEEWWEPYTLGVGPAGAYAAGLDAEHQARLRQRCREMLPEAPFNLVAQAWAARGSRS